MLQSRNEADVDFEDIIIRFSRQVYFDDETVYQLEVRQSPAPLPSGAFKSDADKHIQQFQDYFAQRLSLSQFMNRFEAKPTTAGATGELTKLGHRLYELFPPAFRDAFPQVVQYIFEKGQGVRLILEAKAGDKADRLLGLPWELLFSEDTNVFLAQSPRVILARRLLGAVRRSKNTMQSPLNLIHLIADSGSNHSEYSIDPKLQNLEKEIISRAIEPGSYQLITGSRSIDKLMQVMRKRDYHVIHFLGHGEIIKLEHQPRQERGYLRFVNSGGSSHWITGEQLQYILGLSPSLQLAVLDACRGGANTARNIALELVYHGVPYVVAIQGDILQEAIGYFIKAFYQELQLGRSIAYAVAIGRMAVAIQLPNTLDWCLPVLYTSAGIPEKSHFRALVENLAHWASQPQAPGRIGLGNQVLGVFHLAAGSLVMLSRQKHLLPASRYGYIAIVAFILQPFLSFFTAKRWFRSAIPDQLPYHTKLTAMVRGLSAAYIASGLSSLMTWSALLLLVGIGFWGTLTNLAQTILFTGLLLGGIATSWLLGTSQTFGHIRSFISNASIEISDAMWEEWLVMLGGCILLTGPWLAISTHLELLTPPQGNLILGALLVTMGHILRANHRIS